MRVYVGWSHKFTLNKCYNGVNSSMEGLDPKLLHSNNLNLLRELGHHSEDCRLCKVVYYNNVMDLHVEIWVILVLI